jgi:hypothetical protein
LQTAFPYCVFKWRRDEREREGDWVHISSSICLFVYLFIYLGIGDWTKASHMLNTCSTTELTPQTLVLFFVRTTILLFIRVTPSDLITLLGPSPPYIITVGIWISTYEVRSQNIQSVIVK